MKLVILLLINSSVSQGMLQTFPLSNFHQHLAKHMVSFLVPVPWQELNFNGNLQSRILSSILGHRPVFRQVNTSDRLKAPI